jgi:predicted AAA+ superfamily ATPase
MFKRLLKINKDHHKSCFIFGPRGTGKTSWVVEHFPEALYIDLLKHRDYTFLQGDPTRLEAMVLAHSSPWIIIDEVQKIPTLLDEVHRLIEHHHRCFILTGSSSRKLKRGAANLLAGRALTYHMHPLTAIEIGQSFDLTRAILHGLLPSGYLESDPKGYLESYVATYLREEVLQEGLVRNVGTFNRFMEVASFSQGNQLNLSNIAREVGTSRKIIAAYFEILEDLLISIQLPCFTKRAQRELTQHPKFYYFDAGVFRQLRPKGPLDIPQEISGAAFETLFLQNLRAIIDYYQLDLKIYYWRTVTGIEVDFIVYGENGLFAFELKSKRFIDRKDFSGLHIFKKDYPFAKCYLIYDGERSEKHDDISVLPIRESLLKLPELLQDKSGAGES